MSDSVCHDLKQALESARLELNYQRCLHQAEQIYEEERARALRVQLLLLEDENDEAQEKLEIQTDDLQRAEEVASELRDHLADLEERYQATQAELKACMRDIDNYQIEINALNATSSDSTKLLGEKLALSRELSTLKPELEHLRSQAATQANALTDKLALQREINSIQVELETEKRTVQRLKTQTMSGDHAMNEELEELKKELAKERKALQKIEREQKSKRANDKASADAALIDELETLKQELANERKRSQQAEKEHLHNAVVETETAETVDDLRKEITRLQKASQKAEREQLKKATEWDTQKENLESKLDAFRTKLRSTKDQLKEAQDELERREANKFAESTAATKARLAGKATKSASVAEAPAPTAGPVNARKRPVARFDPDMTIGTPGNGGPAAKKAKRSLASNVGDKSTFSITPFLNRTLSVLPETPGEDIHEQVDQALEDSINEIHANAEREKAEAAKATKKPVKKAAIKPAAESKSKKAAAQPLKETTNPRANAIVKPAALAKVVEEEEPTQQENTATSLDTSKAGEPKKKKLLGQRKTLFDDDDDAKIFKKPGLGKISLGAKGRTKTLAEFSPLKKDRRLGSASVLV